MNRDVIIACDFSSREATLEFLDRFPEGRKPFVKIGMELFYAEGPSIVRDIKARFTGVLCVFDDRVIDGCSPRWMWIWSMSMRPGPSR